MDPLYDVKQKMGELVQFILDNLKKPITQKIQIEFNILYNQYQKTLNEVKENGISEQIAIKMGTKSPVEVPNHLMDEFEKWFSERIDSMLITDCRNHGTSSNN
jgi:hypothetical protein